MEKEYLGDAVYVEYDGVALCLTTEDGTENAYGTDNQIILELDTLVSLMRYCKKVGIL